MRIIAGKYKIRTLPSPKGFKARPTTDFAKENLFNVLTNFCDFNAIDALDLFSGTGSISFELASRGCKSVTSVEKHPKHISYINSIIKRLDINEINVIRADVLKFIKKTPSKYDLIFADPPFQEDFIDEIPELIFNHNILNSKGLFILEHSSAYNFSQHEHFYLRKTYGSVNFSLFKLTL